MVVVDTISYARRLRDAGVSPEQAEAHALAMLGYVQDLASKQDLDRAVAEIKADADRSNAALRSELTALVATLRNEQTASVASLRSEIAAMGQTLTIRLGGLLMAGVAALAAIIKLA